jgi:hypothetical protein
MRMNRGPTWLTASEGPKKALAALAAIIDEGNPKRRLFVAGPNIEMSDESLAMLAASGFRRRLLRPWSSIWVDLRIDQEALWRRLDGKWRNVLVSAEKEGLRLEADDAEQGFAWLLARYGELAIARGFAGPKIPFLRELRRALRKNGESFWVLRAMAGNDAVAGIGMVTHGTSATYLIGWNGPIGRKFGANNFLLWQSVLLAKQKGREWLDLGGIDEWRTPGITDFKRGLHGEEYRLVGEYVKWFGR